MSSMNANGVIQTMTQESKPKKNKIPQLPEGWERCRAFLAQKQRYCRQVPSPDSFYCGNHQELDARTKKNVSQKCIRVPCPIDKTHSIWEDQLEKHIKVCPKARFNKEQKEQPYYREDLNSGGHGELSNQSRNAANQKLEWAKTFALLVLRLHQRIFANSEISVSDVTTLTLDEIENAIPVQDYSMPELEAGLGEAIESYRIRSGGQKHLQQQASLIGHLRNLAGSPLCSEKLEHEVKRQKHEADGLIHRHKTILLELGAGRGMLGLLSAGAFVASGIRDVTLVMVDHSSSRSKAEKILRNHTSTLKGQCLDVEGVKNWQRIQCDIKHVHVPTVIGMTKELQSYPSQDSVMAGLRDNDKTRIVALAKHLCGAGTDLALKSLHPVKDQLDACVMAVCCHGVCNWDDYVGRDFLRSIFENDGDSVDTFGREEFELMRMWSAGTVMEANCAKCAKKEEPLSKVDDRTEEEESHPATQVNEQRKPLLGIKKVANALDLACGVQGLGRACQRLLDYGRREYLRRILFTDTVGEPNENAHVSLCYYVPADVTPQNAVLIAKRNRCVNGKIAA